MKENKIKIVHILMWLVGTAFLASGAFHTGIWFDESYTVGLMYQNIPDLIKSGMYDVHPLFYYIVLRIFAYIFGNGLITLRLFSVLCASLIALLGFTHIRRDFGEKTGFWFTFFVLFMPSTFKYALQIRMYTMTPLLVTLAAIYAYRMMKDEDKKTKNTVLFVVLSILSAYTHYYGLMAVIMINLILLVVYKVRKEKLKKWLIMGGIQIASYIPGGIIFGVQISLGGANWIRIKWETLFDTISFHFLGVPLADCDVTSPVYIITMAFSIFMYVFAGYALYRIAKAKENDIMPAVYALCVYFGVIAAYMLASILFRPVYYVRYTMISYAMLLFAFAYITARIKKPVLKIFIAAFLIVLSVVRAVPIIEENYSPKNTAIDDYLKANMQEGDIFVFDSAGAFAVSVKYQEVPTYFYNIWHWNIEGAYEAFGHNVECLRSLDELRNYNGRIWIINKDNAYKEILSWMGTTEISSEEIKLDYYSKENKYNLILVEKKAMYN